MQFRIFSLNSSGEKNVLVCHFHIHAYGPEHIQNAKTMPINAIWRLLQKQKMLKINQRNGTL